MNIITIETPSLGDRTSIIHDGRNALIVDPQRDIDRIIETLDEHGLVLDAIFETHIHNDYVSGGLQLAVQTGAALHIAADDEVQFERVGVRDGDEVTVGELTVTVLHTPGHTPTHLSYVVASAGRERAVFTGGSLLFGSVGRTDLISSALTEELTRLQYRSVRRLAERLADDVEVHPTHGFGSFCSSGDTSGADSSTIGRERQENDALTADEDTFVADLMAGLDDYPAYYAHMDPRNRRGPEPIDLSPVDVVDVAELRRRMHVGEWVVDLRSRRVYAGNHLTGTVNLELDDSASTYLGWIIPWGTPVTLVGTADDVANVQRQLVRIGIDRPAGRGEVDAVVAAGDGKYEVSDFAGLAAASADVVVLDARLRLEWEDGHLPDAVHVPLHDLLDRMDDVPGGTVWVHCASGYRASIAASLLVRAGRDVVLVDDDFDQHAGEHFELVR